MEKNLTAHNVLYSIEVIAVKTSSFLKIHIFATIYKQKRLFSSSWEIPALKANKVPAVSDSDGVSYPWYGNTTEIATIVGPTDSYTRMNLTVCYLIYGKGAYTRVF